ncbi:hypothetical protein C8Q79DRAFT_189484 [Trametes meyenii]|nr:hypothetical protein C8Q79DRAFT_189484 [Trametes meyenii]
MEPSARRAWWASVGEFEGTHGTGDGAFDQTWALARACQQAVAVTRGRVYAARVGPGREGRSWAWPHLGLCTARPLGGRTGGRGPNVEQALRRGGPGRGPAGGGGGRDAGAGAPTRGRSRWCIGTVRDRMAERARRGSSRHEKRETRTAETNGGCVRPQSRANNAGPSSLPTRSPVRRAWLALRRPITSCGWHRWVAVLSTVSPPGAIEADECVTVSVKRRERCTRGGQC